LAASLTSTLTMADIVDEFRIRRYNRPMKFLNGRLTVWIISAVGILISGVALGLSLILFLQQGDRREPQIAIVQGPYLIYDPTVTTRIRLVETEEEPIWGRFVDAENSRIWGTELMIWNSGKESIKTSNGDVLTPLKIQLGTAEQHPTIIWDIPTLAWSRPEIKFQIPSGAVAHKNNGVPLIPLDFEILETDDGASVLLIYSGPKELDISLIGSVEGRKGVGTFGHSERRNLWKFGLTIFVTGMAGIITFGGVFVLFVAYLPPYQTRVTLCVVGLGLVVVIVGTIFLLTQNFTIPVDIPSDFQPISSAD